MEIDLVRNDLMSMELIIEIRINLNMEISMKRIRRSVIVVVVVLRDKHQRADEADLILVKPSESSNNIPLSRIF